MNSLAACWCWKSRPCRCPAWTAIPAICAACAFWASGALAADASLEERFLKEAPVKWLEYRQIVARHTEGRAKGTNALEYGNNETWLGEWDMSFALTVADKHASAKVVKFEKGVAKTVEASNPRYSFELKAGRGGQWTIERLLSGATPVPDDLVGRHPIRPLVMGEATTLGSAMHQACLGQKLGVGWLPKMVASSDFQLTRVASVGRGGLVKVEFRFEPKEQTGGAYARSGTVVLDPKRYWLIVEADTATGFNVASEDETLNRVRGTLSIRNTLTEPRMRVPYVSRQAYTAACEKGRDGKPWKEVDNTTIDLRDVPEMDEKQFRLSGYGLPEPPAKK